MSSLKKLSIVAAAVVLTACGGGGGGDSGSSDPVPPTTNPPVVDNKYPTDVTPANYADTQRANVLNTLNEYRTQCGFNSLKQNSLLDTAAQGHAVYNQVNLTTTHTQNSNLSGFTAKTQAERISNSGYQYSSIGEIVGGNYAGTLIASNALNGIEYSSSAPTGNAVIKNLLSTVYHLAGAMEEWNDVGVGFSVSSNLTSINNESNYYATTVVNFGNSAGSEPPAYKSDEIRSFPCNGIQGVNPIFKSEEPNPFPNRDLYSKPMGTPIFISSPKNKKLVIVEAVITNESDMTTIKPNILNIDNDAQHLLKSWEGFIVPDTPLKNNSTYSINAKLQVDGVETVKLIKFTTGLQY